MKSDRLQVLLTKAKAFLWQVAEGTMSQEETPHWPGASRNHQEEPECEKNQLRKLTKNNVPILFSHFKHKMYTCSAHESQPLKSTSKAIYFGQAHKRVSKSKELELEKCYI